MQKHRLLLTGILVLLTIVLIWISFSLHQKHEQLVKNIESSFAFGFSDIQSDVNGLLNTSEYPITTSQSWRTFAVDLSDALKSLEFLFDSGDLSKEEIRTLSSIQTTMRSMEPFISDSWRLLFGKGENFEISYCPDSKITISTAEEVQDELLNFKKLIGSIETGPGTGNEVYEQILNQWDSSKAYDFRSCNLN